MNKQRDKGLGPDVWVLELWFIKKKHQFAHDFR